MIDKYNVATAAVLRLGLIAIQPLQSTANNTILGGYYVLSRIIVSWLSNRAVYRIFKHTDTAIDKNCDQENIITKAEFVNNLVHGLLFIPLIHLSSKLAKLSGRQVTYNTSFITIFTAAAQEFILHLIANLYSNEAPIGVIPTPFICESTISKI